MIASDMRALADRLDAEAGREARVPELLRAPVLIGLAEEAADLLRVAASAIEAGTAETAKTGSVHESAVPKGGAQ